MDVLRPSLPPKLFIANVTDAKVRPIEQTTEYMAARGCHFIECSLYILLINIESFFLTVREAFTARTVLYKLSILVLSRTFSQKSWPRYVAASLIGSLGLGVASITKPY